RRGKLRVRRERRDLRELRLERREAEPFDARRVEVAGIQIADLALGAARGRIGLRGVLENAVERVAALLGQLVERAPGRCIGRNGRLGEPGAVHEAEEIVLRANGAVEVRGVDAESAGGSLLLLGGGDGGKRQKGDGRQSLGGLGGRSHVPARVCGYAESTRERTQRFGELASPVRSAYPTLRDRRVSMQDRSASIANS